MSGSATPQIPDTPRNVLQLKDADDLMAKYVQLADLSFDEFTPEAVEEIFGIKFSPRQAIGTDGFGVRFDQSTPKKYPLELTYSKYSLPHLGLIDTNARWSDFPPPIHVEFKKLKAELEKHAWVISGPSSNTHGGPAIDAFARSVGNKKCYIRVDWTQADGVVQFEVRHEFAVGEQK